ncbi:helix-turn-helix transcriptional regulator [Streptomyces lancefieldiae]|uniref:Helix-turn-helix transcriptional regulator n=1 Tax=Streptomyces lancefieldiae TaxID=3075520 RepID=A0ABU3AS35_9ACTN|nr:helix-turn-helix transcriptional regulator [Streptomyces sp. DSM 40712]MDT0612738.1 helix-turn-helix transcriptional regulator [Streptomyces sp. DSM 40712]
MPERAAFAHHLRALRHAADLTYAELAELVPYSTAQLKRAAGGRYLPPFPLAFAYASACHDRMEDGDLRRTALRRIALLHDHAEHAAAEHKLRERRSTVLAKPDLARNRADLGGAMRDQWAYAGRPPYRRIERKTKNWVPHSTAHMIVTARTIPRDLQQYVAFLEACKVCGLGMTPWLRAWIRVCGFPRTDEEFARTTERMNPVVNEVYRKVLREEYCALLRRSREDENPEARELEAQADRELHELIAKATLPVRPLAPVYRNRRVHRTISPAAVGIRSGLPTAQ